MLAVVLAALAACGTGDGAPADAGPEPTDAPSTITTDATPASTAPATAPTSPPSPPAVGAPPALSADTRQLSATIEQYREDEVKNQLSLKITNGGDDVRISTLALAWPALVGAEPLAPDYLVAAGVRVDLRVAIGRAVCSDPPQFDEVVPPVAIAAVATIDGDAVTFPVTDPNGILAKIYPKACIAQAIEHAVDISFGSEWIDAGAEPPTVTNTLTFTRRHGDLPIEVVDVFGSVVVSIAGDGVPTTLDSGEVELALPVTFTNNRCDSHALGETKKPFLFQVQLRIGDQEASYFITPDDAGKDALFAGILNRCPPETDP